VRDLHLELNSNAFTSSLVHPCHDRLRLRGCPKVGDNYLLMFHHVRERDVLFRRSCFSLINIEDCNGRCDRWDSWLLAGDPWRRHEMPCGCGRKVRCYQR
jgi:hypothetical protein